MNGPLYGAIEAGGTKFVCAVGSGPFDMVERVRIDTTDPDTTLSACLEFFEGHPDIVSLGIASFGPLELRRDSERYGSITETPKPGWSGTDLISPFAEGLGIPVGFDTDVNGAALAEFRWGAAADVDSCIYLTVGTGVGGGAVIGGRPVHGLVHPEMGHVSIERRPGDDFEGICPFHGDCLEGLACGPAIEARWGAPAQELDHLLDQIVEIEADTIAAGLRQFVYVVAPDLIVIGGGVAHLAGLHEAVNARLIDHLSGYGIQEEHRSGFVVPPGLGDEAGAAGAIALAMEAQTP